LRVRFLVGQYLGAHKRSPRGFGYWIFRIGNKDIWIRGTYTQAKKAAAKAAREAGVTEVTVMP